MQNKHPLHFVTPLLNPPLMTMLLHLWQKREGVIYDCTSKKWRDWMTLFKDEEAQTTGGGGGSELESLRWRKQSRRYSVSDTTPSDHIYTHSSCPLLVLTHRTPELPHALRPSPLGLMYVMLCNYVVTGAIYLSYLTYHTLDSSAILPHATNILLLNYKYA